MGLTGWLRRYATPCPLLVTVRGGGAMRLAAERELRERGWAFASAPAEADLFVVCGVPGPELQDAVERVWSELPSPRARADIRDEAGAAGALDRAHARLDDAEEQRADTQARGGGGVAELPMADRAPDRDGLVLDQLHVSLGPVLPDWPAGVALQLTIQGDVVQSAEVEVVGESGVGTSPWAGDARAAALDSVARLLTVCGCDTAARTARRLRDQLLAGVADDAELHRFTRRLRRSRTLRWATDGLGYLEGARGDLAGDATQRWRRWIEVVEQPERSGRPYGGRAERAQVALEVLPELLEGQELTAVRVVVASLDPDLDALPSTHPQGAQR
ncbi:MAG: hypothetical protein ACR2GH_12435 [Pseudonocardia sp.]